MEVLDNTSGHLLLGDGKITDNVCPCDTIYKSYHYVGEDYFCESGYVYPNGALENRLHSNDTLWDGEDCHSSSSCCSLHNPPYFTKSLSQLTTDDLELRMCSIHGDTIAIELLEVYVKEVDLLGLIGDRTEEHMKEVKSKLMEINTRIFFTILFCINVEVQEAGDVQSTWI